MPAKSKQQTSKSVNEQKIPKAKKKTAQTEKKVQESNLTVDVLDTSGKKKGTVLLPQELFGVPINRSLIAQAVRVYLTNQRQSSAVVQTRGEVTGSGRKIWRQKGTGRARHGHRYAGIFVGGGKAHGPRPRTFENTLNRKMRKRALASALSSQLKSNNIIVVDGLETIDGKTKTLVSLLGKLTSSVKYAKAQQKLLIATSGKKESLYRPGKNAQKVTVREAELLHTYEVINNRKIILSKQAIDVLEKSRFS